jgi:hypothetical protein
VNGNIVGSAESPVEPILGPLSDNGGLQTHALQPGSPAIDSGNNERADDRRGNPLLADQRGFVRLANAIVDMGAYESASQPLVISSTVQGQAVNATGRGIAGARVELRDAGGEVRYAMTNPFGFFQFADVTIDQNYTIKCLDKRNVFPSQNVLIEESIEYVKFIAAPF